MNDTFLLLHSPLIGPYSWMPVADELRRRGHRAIVPSFLHALRRSSGFTEAISRSVAEEIAKANLVGRLFLVPHSAAGAFTPALRQAIAAPVHGYIFVDARFPTVGQSLSEDDPPHAVEHRSAMARKGFLPPWSEWFGEQAMKEVIPDDTRRQRFVKELQRVPLALFTESIPVPSEWPEAPCAYLRLSDSYIPLAARAETSGWTVAELDVQHMHMLVDEVQVTEHILDLAGRLAKRRE